MDRRVAVVDYGMGNLLSVARALERCGAEVELASGPAQIEAAEMLVLPGVGAFANGMSGLAERDLVEPLRAYGRSGRPLLGICLGMHMLMETSSEFGEHEGLGLVPGRVEPVPRVDAEGNEHRVPHIGWSPLRPRGDADWSRSVLRGIPEGESFYFVHSFAAAPADETHCLADTSYAGGRIAAVVTAGAVVGTQFHPEKSGAAGLRLIENFVEGGLAKVRVSAA